MANLSSCDPEVLFELKRPISSAWFKEKLMPVEAQEAGQILDKEELAFIIEDLDAYDSDCDDISSAKAVLMENLSSSDSDVLSEVPYSDTYLNDMINQEGQEMSYSEQTHIMDFPNNEINNDSNIIPYSQYKMCENVKKDIDEIETMNIELEHSVAKLLSENENLRKEREHLKSIYKDQFDSIRKTRVRSKEHSEYLIAHIKAKFVENSDLNAQHQEKVFAIAALKNELRKLKRKNDVHTADSTPFATTIAR
ncbi:hypothetical protein Tco_0245629 [Tanacetum coccineum]